MNAKDLLFTRTKNSQILPFRSSTTTALRQHKVHTTKQNTEQHIQHRYILNKKGIHHHLFSTRTTTANMSTDIDTYNNNDNDNMSCTIKDFIYYDINRNVVEGTKTKLFPPLSSSSSSSSSFNTNNENKDEDSDLDYTCIFDTANCHPSSLPHECCTYNKASIIEQTNSWSTQYMIVCVLIPILYIKTSIKEKEKKKKSDNNGSTENENEADDNDDKEEINDNNIIPWYIAKIPKSKLPIRSLLIWIWSKGFLSFMMLTVPASIALRNSYQTNLSVSNRNLMIAADAFMIPYQTIFNFIEDIILVQIGYALGRNDKIKTNQLIHTGIAGSIVTGIIAGAIGTVLGLVPTIFQSLTNPGLHHDQLLYKGCEFFENDISESESSKTATAHATVLPYWMMKSWSMIFQQIGMVMSGFFFGSKATMEIGWIMTISLSLNLYIWFTYVDTSSNPLTLIGMADYVYDFTIPLLTILYLVTPLGSQICNRTGVHLSFTKLLSVFLQFKPSKTASSASSASSASTSVNETTKLIKDVDDTKKKKNNEESSTSTSMSTSTIDLLLDGLKVMFMDVAIQGCVSFTLYVALLEDSAVAYQISALQSALPAYGYGYALGISMMFKLIGSTLLAQNKYMKFVQFATICVLCVLLLIPGIVISVVQDRHEIALVYGSNACVYASNKQCVNFFTEIFGINGDGISSDSGDGDGDSDSGDRGNYTLQYTMTALAFGSIIDSISLVLRSILLSLLDFDFLVKSTICAVIFAYIPAMYIATYGAGVNYKFQRTAFAWYIAMNTPQLFLIFAFLIRLYYNLKRLLNDDDGPWMMETEVVDDDDGNRNSCSSDALTLDRTSTTATKEKQRSYRSELTPLLLSQRRRSSAST